MCANLGQAPGKHGGKGRHLDQISNNQAAGEDNGEPSQGDEYELLFRLNGGNGHSGSDFIALDYFPPR